jgi:O-antigen biosynthesis protein
MLNTAHESTTDLYYNQPRPSILSRVQPGPNLILDLGCGTGAVGRGLMAAGKASQVVGVELFEAAAAVASQYYAKVYTGDIEVLELPYHRAFDYVICGDILEHLREPAAVLRKIHRWLKDDGWLVCSVPNIRYWRVLYDLAVKGQWEYTDAGVLDKTHLRFFTRRSCFRMVTQAGFAVSSSHMLIYGRRWRMLNALTLRMLEDVWGSQVVVVAHKEEDERAPVTL